MVTKDLKREACDLTAAEVFQKRVDETNNIDAGMAMVCVGVWVWHSWECI